MNKLKLSIAAINRSFRILLTPVIICGLFTCNVYANNKVFVDGYKLNHVYEQDGRMYVQLHELSHYIGYALDYDAASKTVSAYKQDCEKPIIVRESTLFPTHIEELNIDGNSEIIKVYELANGESPKEIPKESFEKNGYIYELTDITKSSSTSIDSKDHTQTVTVETASNDMAAILSELKEEIEYTDNDGYSGTLKLNISSIESGVTGYQNSSFTSKEVREYPNLSSPDTSLVPKSIDIGGKSLSLANVQWKTANTVTVDYEQLSDNYTAVATYTRTGTTKSVTGYTTTAQYSGEISKILEGKTIYTAYFSGVAIESEPEEVPEPTAAALKAQLAERNEQEKAERKANGEIIIEPLHIIMPLIILSGIGSAVYLLLFKRNVQVLSLKNGYFEKIGKARINKKDCIIDLTPFTAKVTSPSFRLELGRFSTKVLDGKTVNINYGDSSFQHIVTLDNDMSEKKGYVIEVDF